MFDQDPVELRKNNKKLQAMLKKERLEREHKDRLSDLYKYYANTEIPLDRIAMHIGVSEEEAKDNMMVYGRRF